MTFTEFRNRCKYLLARRFCQLQGTIEEGFAPCRKGCCPRHGKWRPIVVKKPEEKKVIVPMVL